jgi:hypothetical protein
MLPIPKELQGQKAIPFMEWYICYYSNYGGTMDVITDFYSQPFTPEMLEYFEDKWIKPPNDINYSLFKDEDEKVCIYLDFYPDYCKYTFGDIGDNMFIFKTLNDLITLCNLAGETLTWKGEK